MLTVDDKEYEAKESTSSVTDIKEYTKGVQFLTAFFIFTFYPQTLAVIFYRKEEYFCTLLRSAISKYTQTPAHYYCNMTFSYKLSQKDARKAATLF
jgi:hypothetical protein